MPTADARRAFAPGQVILVLAPAAISLIAAVFVPAWGPDPAAHRITNTIWLTTILLIPALCLFALPETAARRRYALLFYTAAYAAFMAHFYYAVFVHFGGIAGTFAGMRKPVATTNFVLTAWWTVDLLVAWLAPLGSRSVRAERFLAMTFLYLVFVVTELYLRPTEIRYLGLAMAVLVPACLLARLSGPARSRARSHGRPPDRTASARGPTAHDPRTPPPVTRGSEAFTMIVARQFLTVGVLFLVLLGLSELFAQQQTKTEALKRDMEARRAQAAGVPIAPADLQASVTQTAPLTATEWDADCPPIVRDVHYFRVINTIASTYILVLPALCIFAYRRQGEPMGYWLAFWTFAVLMYIIHVLAAVGGMMNWNWGLIFHCPLLVNHPYNDVPLSILWILDVVLAWGVVLSTGDIWKSPRWVRAERGIVHFWLFVSLTGVWITKAENWYIRGLGFTLTTLVILFALARIVIKPFDSDSFVGRLYVGLFHLINIFRPWHKLSTWLAILNLGAYRETLRKKNLHNTSTIPVSNPARLTPDPVYHPDVLLKRDDDGYFNDLHKGAMGGASTDTGSIPPVGVGPEESLAATRDSMYFNKSQPCARFGRNVPLKDAFGDEANLLNPNPRLISEKLLQRTDFKPAKILNLLAAAWIQFETHDWFNHGEPPFEGEKEANPDIPFTSDQIKPHLVPISDGDKWEHGCPMKVRPTRPDPTRDYEKERRENGGKLRYPKTYVNAESHWWDASQIYGSNPTVTRRLRTKFQTDADGNLPKGEDGKPQLIPPPDGELVPDGKLFLTNDGLSLDPSTGTALSGFTGNWWLGLSLLHTLFTREHNAICDAIRREHPCWPNDEVFRVARLVNSALIEKIHTIEWTPAILQHPALQIGMRANWWGLLTEDVKRAFGRISQNEAFSGIPGSGVDHGISPEDGGVADYCLTEEFVTVYRLHSLMPDVFEVYSAKTGQPIPIPGKVAKPTNRYILPDGFIGDMSRLNALNNGATMGDLFYSFGIAWPGAVTLHNFPNFLRNLTRPTAFGVTETIDLATIDIVRDRERGVPRYNQFLRLLHRKPISSFDDFQNPAFPELGQELRAIYGQTNGRDNVELLDTMVGMFAEVVPEGFGFSDTAFRVFILMASRRLKSDRFIAGEAFNPDVYSQVGFDWVANTTMIDVLLRHYPELGPSLYDVPNAFAPWKRVENNPAA